MRLLKFSMVVVILIFESCSAYLTSSENVSKVKKSYEKILVVGRSKDKIARIKFENEVVAQLNQKGVNAMASSDIDGTKILSDNLTENQTEALRAELVSLGFDGVIITNLINTEEYTDVIPGNSSTTYIPTRYGRFGRHIGFYPVSTWEPDQLQTGTKYIFESTFYNIINKEGDNLEWVGRFELKNPSSIDKIANNYAKELVTVLTKESIRTNQ